MPGSCRAGVVLAAIALSLPFASPFSTCVSVRRLGCAAPRDSGGGGAWPLRCLGERGRLRTFYRRFGCLRDRRHGCAGAVCMSSEGARTGFEQQAGFPARFPERVEDAMEQAGDAVLAALDDGMARVRIQLNLPEFNPVEMPMERGCVVSFLNSRESRNAFVGVCPHILLPTTEPRAIGRMEGCCSSTHTYARAHTNFLSLPPGPPPALPLVEDEFAHSGTPQWEGAWWTAGCAQTLSSTPSRMPPRPTGSCPP